MDPASSGRAPHRKVLVVDDDPRARAAVMRLLEAEGYDASEAADGEEATGLLASWRPDLVLTDLQMPRLDGRGLLGRVRRLLPGTPVILVTGRGDAGAALLADGGGASAYLAKPLEVEALLARIRELIGR